MAHRSADDSREVPAPGPSTTVMRKRRTVGSARALVGAWSAVTSSGGGAGGSIEGAPLRSAPRSAEPSGSPVGSTAVVCVFSSLVIQPEGRAQPGRPLPRRAAAPLVRLDPGPPLPRDAGAAVEVEALEQVARRLAAPAARQRVEPLAEELLERRQRLREALDALGQLLRGHRVGGVHLVERRLVDVDPLDLRR